MCLKNATAFVHRFDFFFAFILPHPVFFRDVIGDLQWDVCYFPGQEGGTEGEEWVKDGFEKFVNARIVGEDGIYQNYPFLSIENGAQMFYGENYGRLQAIKAKYDPEFYFHFPLCIAP